MCIQFLIKRCVLFAHSYLAMVRSSPLMCPVCCADSSLQPPRCSAEEVDRASPEAPVLTMPHRPPSYRTPNLASTERYASETFQND